MRMDELILYRTDPADEILRDMAELIGGAGGAKLLYRNLCYRTTAKLLKVSSEMGFAGNLWHDYLAYYLVNHENAFSLSAEMRQISRENTIRSFALHDLEIFREFFACDIRELDSRYDAECFGALADFLPDHGGGRRFSRRIRDRIVELAKDLAGAESAGEMLQRMERFYQENGTGMFGLHKAFRLRDNAGDRAVIEPIVKTAPVQLSDLVGYNAAKQMLIENTEAFVEGKKANNCLLYGDAGTGKSSSVKGILNRFFAQGLRVIEIYKHQFRYLNDLVSQIKDRNYRFIIFMDDLSFEDNETEYKYLKALIEGGLEVKPDNILIYATSNRRHLVHENFRDKLDRYEDDDIHESDTVQEKLSLYNRFGVTIYFGRPDPKLFKTIVLELAKRNGLDLPEEELLLQANRWELSHGGLSGRTAQQFIDYCISVR
ncbi:MAG: ATP-binding protein [Lachnospiraceae bacterium]|nr:ATP-binding protein [Lachnospiraceae bacterium]